MSSQPKKRIYVGLSGGVDSAVTAALLQKEGHEVTGVFIKGWYPEGMPCTWAQDRQDAMRVAARLGIPFITLDASLEYKKAVIDYLIAEYREGRTPNPDIMCNREVKFGAFYSFAKARGADAIATGHYAKTIDGNLYCGVDEAKDQSYFLWAVPSDVLGYVQFPLGGFRKEYVRTLAKKFKLPVATKRDSQGICFLGSISVEEFLLKELGSSEGQAFDESGRLIGTHKGAVLYTLGERVALAGATPGPWYVLAKDIAANTITVSHGSAKKRSQEAIALAQVNLFETTMPAVVEAQYRYHGARIVGSFDTATNTFHPTQALTEPVARGQSLVLYDKERCLGGGIIV